MTAFLPRLDVPLCYSCGRALEAEQQPAPPAGLSDEDLARELAEEYRDAFSPSGEALHPWRHVARRARELLPQPARCTERELALCIREDYWHPHFVEPPDEQQGKHWRRAARAAAARLGVPLAPEPQQGGEQPPPEPRTAAAAEQPAEPSDAEIYAEIYRTGWLAAESACKRHKRRAAELEERLLLAADALARAEQRARFLRAKLEEQRAATAAAYQGATRASDRAEAAERELADLRGRAAAAIERLATPGSGELQLQPAAGGEGE